jgi:Family of unknown function (DUF5681)
MKTPLPEKRRSDVVKRVRLDNPKIGRSDEVGYRKPPKRTQFEPGKSGNPKGRPKGVPNFSTDVGKALSKSVKVHKNGRDSSISTQMASLMVLREKALHGDLRALDHLLDLASRFEARQQAAPARKLDVDDRAILATYVKEALEQHQGEERLGLEPVQPKMTETVV